MKKLWKKRIAVLFSVTLGISTAIVNPGDAGFGKAEAGRWGEKICKA